MLGPYANAVAGVVQAMDEPGGVAAPWRSATHRAGLGAPADAGRSIARRAPRRSRPLSPGRRAFRRTSTHHPESFA
jgi:hypothetical protein